MVAKKNTRNTVYKRTEAENRAALYVTQTPAQIIADLDSQGLTARKVRARLAVLDQSKPLSQQKKNK